VLELCWTLARGFTIVLAATDQPAALVPVKRAGSTRPVSFSLYYFASGESNEGDKYRMLLEGAKFADEHGFEAVWTPERHFHAFGGLYPSPAVASAALAAITTRVKIRAGSVVLPLHHPIRVAEEWALVDNISKGRVGISFASGWQPNDFVLRPDAFSKQKEIMMRDIDVVRRLWRGETIPFPGAQGKDVPIRTLPRPVQPELPFWITTAGNPESFAAAGKAGAGVLTHLLGQSVEELAPKLESYRAAWKAAGHEGEGKVSLMLHAFVGEDPEYVRETVRGPMVEYLRSSVSLIKHYAWAFPTFRNAPKTGDGGVDLTTLSEDELNALLEHAFDRYYKTSGLFGTPENCLAMVDSVRAIGVDEIACLIDFGVPTETTLQHLPLLDQVRRMATADPAEDRSLAAELRRHQVTHLQCTPVLARLLAASTEAHEGLRGLKRMMVGGEAFPAALSDSLRRVVGGEIHNMYGPTETTIWSTTHLVNSPGNVPLGAPIANTRVYVLDNQLQPVPIGVPGELCIGGAGVTRGYLGRPELTAERFVRDPFVVEKDARMYRTGDLVRWRPDGALEFLGRLDHQVKVRGFRIELGEIEAALRASDIVADTVVVVREDGEDKRIVAYVVAKQGAPQDAGRLRDTLRAGLPEYMVPGAFVFMEALPLTLNGKVDRKQLPDPATVQGAKGAGGGAPTSALEQSIAAIWKDVLQTGTVGLDDNFFDIGGHSLLAVQAHRRMREGLNKDMPITALFQYPTVRMLAAHLDNGGNASATVQASVDRAEGRRAAMARRVASRRGEGN
jgi:natural product biosynthesis luciferase-like monooxygenase protein